MSHSSVPAAARRTRYVAYFALAAIAAILLLNFYESDANFVTYRFAANLAAGWGLRYGMPGADVTTFPLVPILLALFAPVVDVSFTGWLSAIISLGAGAIYLSRLLGERPAAGVAYILANAIAPAPVVALMLALALAGLDFARRGRWSMAGVLVGFAILAEPSALALGVLILPLALRESWRAVRRFGLLAALVAAPPMALLIAASGRAVSVTPGAWGVLLPPLAVIVFAVRRGRDVSPYSGALIAWSALVGLAALAGGTMPSAAILPGAIAAVVWGGANDIRRWLPLEAILIGAVAFDGLLRLGLTAQQMAINLEDPRSALIVGQYITERTGGDAVVATREIGALAYTILPRPVIDMSGQLADNPVDRFFIFRHAPDLLVIHDPAEIPWPNFPVTYANTFSDGDLKLYQRVVNFSSLDDHPVDVDFSDTLGRDDLRLVGVGIGNALRPGDLVRVRLDWLLAYVPAHEVEIKLDLLKADGSPLAGALDKIPAAEWRAGRLSTYHVLSLPGDAPPGDVLLFLNVGLRGGNFGARQVVTTSVRP